jgi:hypothetical protein
MANLQGFPESYEFEGRGLTEVKTQIGNAIPPNVWKHYIKCCVDTLEKFDAGLIDETGRPVERQVAEAGPLSPFATLSGKIAQSASDSPMRSARTSAFDTPSMRRNINAPLNNTPRSFAFASSFKSSSSSKSAFLRSPSPATHPSRTWSEESRTLSPEPSPFRTRLSPFKRNYEMIDLTEDVKKAKKGGFMDLTGDD